jgi:hypothetical protein
VVQSSFSPFSSSDDDDADADDDDDDDRDDDDDVYAAARPEPAPPQSEGGEGDSAGLWVNVDAVAARKSLERPQPWSADAAGRGLLLVGDVGADGKTGLPWPLPPFSFGEIGHHVCR